MRAFRAILLLELLDRFIRTDPEKRLMRLQEELAEKEREVDELRGLIASAEAEIAAREAELAKVDDEKETAADQTPSPDGDDASVEVEGNVDQVSGEDRPSKSEQQAT